MCGFVAVFSKGAEAFSREKLKSMGDLIDHRGPDSEGIFLDPRASFIFKRLSIQDTSSAGQQPMYSSDKRFIICFNGEVYNYKELRAELKSLGYDFHSGSDTEVVLNAYLEWGDRALLKFIGMFAFVIFNIESGEAFVARDHLGIKPLFIHEDDNFLYLASEIKAFTSLKRLSLNRESLYEQLTFRYVYGVQTPFRDVTKFSEGSFGKIKNGSLSTLTSFYRVYESLNERAYSVDEADIEKQLEDSIFLHTRSDVGYNVQLSGGVDSSFVTAVLGERSERLSTYSVAIPGTELDESEFQKVVATQYNCIHHEVKVAAKDFADSLDRATWAMDVPIVHLGCVFLKLLCQESKENSKVILTGEGADELFAGYSRYSFDKWSKIVFSLLDSGIDDRWIPDVGSFGKLKKRLADPIVYKQLHFEKSIQDSFFPDLKPSLVDRERVIDEINSSVNKMLAHDQAAYLSSLLDRQDRMSMSESVESRVPFCNPKLFDLVNPINFSDKVDGGETKAILKRIAVKRLPENLIYRRKRGLTIPIDDWMRSGVLRDRLSLLTDKTASSRDFYDSRRVSEAVDLHLKGKVNYGKYLSTLMMFETWHRMFID